jgi:CRISPR-associated protein Cas2
MFDLPVDSTEAKRQYSRFRTSLLKQGFSMLQYSVYARFCADEERAATIRKRLHGSLPPGGEVRLLHVTDIQFGKMEVYLGKRKGSPEKPPDQLQLF